MLKEYDFVSNSLNSFRKKYRFWGPTIRSYLNKYDIPYNKRKQKIVRLRDEFGRFCLTHAVERGSIENKNTSTQDNKIKHNIHQKSKKCKTFKEMAAKQY